MEKINRNQFIKESFLGFALLSSTNLGNVKGKGEPKGKSFTVQEVMDKILKEGKLNPIPNTVDTLKSGTSDQVVTGIMTTMFTTLPTIEEAIRIGANFIITHEPSFYNHPDDPNFVENNQVLKQKMDMLHRNKIAVWRFHDYIHSIKPDLISYGVCKKLGWEPYYQTNNRIMAIPPIRMKDLISLVKNRLSIEHFRFIGDMETTCSKIGLMPGAVGGQSHIRLLEREKPDVLLVGECPEWETVEYMRDSLFFGNKSSLIILGHGKSETPGVEYLADWLGPIFPEIKITYMPFQDPFTWI